MAVGVAEGIVRREWGLALLRWRDQMEFERRAAEADCRAACDAVAAALRDGGAAMIAAAHAALDTAVETALAASLKCERVRREVRKELDLLGGSGRGRTIADHARRLQGGVSRATGQGLEIPDDFIPQGVARYAGRWLRVRLLRLR